MVRTFVYYTPEILKYSTKPIKIEVHKRDVCQLCFKRKLLVTHHINYNKEDSHPFNLITLCQDCHIRTYKHKNDWLRLFSERMEQRFGARYRLYLHETVKKAKSPNKT